jgi:hypothetical protein
MPDRRISPNGGNYKAWFIFWKESGFFWFYDTDRLGEADDLQFSGFFTPAPGGEIRKIVG